MQVFKNTFWTVLDIAIYPACMIIATPLFIHKLGNEMYGIWMMATVVNQYMNVFNFGLGESTIKSIASARSNTSPEKVTEEVHHYWSAAVFICLGCLLLGILVAFSGLTNYWFHVPDKLQYLSSTILCFAFGITAVKFMEIVLLSIFKGHERFDIAAQLSIVSRNSVLLANIIVVLFGFSLDIVLCAAFIIALINVCIQLFIAKRHYPHLKLIPKTQFKLQFKNKNQFWYWLQYIIGLFGFLSDKMLIGYFTNLKVLGLYSIASMIGSQIHNAMLTLGSFLFPKVAHIKSTQNSALPLYKKARFYMSTLAALIIISILLIGPTILPIWLGHAIYEEAKAYIYLYLIFILFMSLSIIPYHFFNGSEDLKYNSALELGLRLSHILGMLITYWLMGPIGIVWGLIISTALFIPIQYFIFHWRFFGWQSFQKSFIILIPNLAILLLSQDQSLVLRALALLLFMGLQYFIYFRTAQIKFGKA